jgi:acyl-CoA thioester hydrolase
MTDFSIPIRVYWEDTDGGGIVYYANYLKFAERARTEWLRAQGHEQAALKETTGIGFVVREAHVRYRHPARLDDLLAVTVRVMEKTTHKLLLSQQISCGDALCADITVTLVAVDAMGRLVALPV